MSSSLSLVLQDGYQELARQVDEVARLELALARAGSEGERSQRGEALQAVVLAYRAGPRARWGPVLLDLLAPTILDRLQRLKASPPVIDLEDIRQQLICEVLLAAASMPLPDNPCYLRRALIARANQGVRRKLARERAQQLVQRPFDPIQEERR